MSCRYLKIEDFCSTGSGGTPSRAKPEYYEGEISLGLNQETLKIQKFMKQMSTLQPQG